MTLLLAALLLSASVSDASDAPSVADDAPAAVEILAAPVEPPYGVFDRLAACEAGGDWHAVSPGGRYRGGIQADAQFWANYGGLQYAPRADLASRAQQIVVAERGLAAQGPRAWPICGPRVGLGAYR